LQERATEKVVSLSAHRLAAGVSDTPDAAIKIRQQFSKYKCVLHGILFAKFVTGDRHQPCRTDVGTIRGRRIFYFLCHEVQGQEKA